jgi:hypothetical protein
MAIEMSAIKIRSNNNIKGLETQGLKTKVSLYDGIYYLDPSTAS